MKKTIATTVLIVIMVFVVPGVMSVAIESLPANSQPPFTTSQRVFRDEVINQKFVSDAENISAIGLSLKNPNLKEQTDVVLKVYDEKGVLLRESSINGKYISDGGFIKFKFFPIEQSKNSNFSFSLTSSMPLSDHNLEIFLTEENGSGSGLEINQKVVDHKNISYVVFEKVLDRKGVLIDTYKNWWNKFAEDSFFAGFYIIFIFGIIYYFLKLNIKKSI